MEATVAERGQITLPKAVRDALGLTKGTKLNIEIEGGRLILIGSPAGQFGSFGQSNYSAARSRGGKS